MKLFIVVCIILVAYLGYEYLRVQKLIKVSQNIVKATVPFSNLSQDTSISLLVLGDSTAVGVGSQSSDQSVPALFAQHVGATYTENHAVSGAKVADLKEQLTKIKLTYYDYILIQIGGNNTVARDEAQQVAAGLKELYKQLPKSGQAVHISCGNVGAATLLPWFVRNYYTKKTLAYHAVFAEMDAASGVTYVNLYEPKATDPFIRNPEIYLAADGFHPSGAGYKLWFLKMQNQIRVQ